jgi:hypothetical protein
MRRRYQVFISSTYLDLLPERQAVLHATLQLGHIPAGMELFPAANEDAWTHIRNVIDECDYYIVLVAGRYGSCDETGLSYTEREYLYAVERGIPVLGFVHSDPDSLPPHCRESTAEATEKLSRFRKLVQQRLVRYWRSPDDLAAAVAASLTAQVARTPGIGWLRGTSLSATIGSQLRGYDVIYTAGTDLCKRADRSIKTLTLAQSMKAPPSFFDTLLKRLVYAKSIRKPVAYDAALALDLSQPNEVLLHRGLAWQRRLEDSGVADCATLYIFDMRPPVGFELLVVDEMHAIIGFTMLHKEADLQTALLFEDSPEVARDFSDWLQRLVFPKSVLLREWRT